MNAADLIATEERIAAHWNAGDINGLTHMHASADGEHEQWLCDFYRTHIRDEDWVLGSHRSHLHALLTGSYTPDQLVERVLAGRSMALYGPRFITSAIVGGICGIACGLALAGNRVFAFVGDGCEDEGAFYEAVMLVHGRDLPVTFVIEDNGSSCGVSQEQRGVGKRMPWPDCVIRKKYTQRYPHAGTGEKITLKSLLPSH